MFLKNYSKPLLSLGKNNILINKRLFNCSSLKRQTSKTPTFIDDLGNKYTPPNIEKYVTKEYYPDNLPKSFKKEIDDYLLNFRMINNRDWKNLTLLEKQKLYFLEYGKIGIRDPESKMTKEAYIYKLIFQVLLTVTILTAFSQLYKDKNYLKTLEKENLEKEQ